MKQPVIYVFTHDSLAVGEDGPTHQPVEHIVSLRIIPGLTVIRPADAHETVQAWQAALARRTGPTALVLTRQKVPVLDRPAPGAVARGAYVKAEASGGVPAVIIAASGSEVALALGARQRLQDAGFPTRVVSAPSLDLLAEQPPAYWEELFGVPGAVRVAVEAGRGQGWHRWVGDGVHVVLHDFGASAPGDEVMRRRGFSVEAVTERVLAALGAAVPAGA